MIGEKDIASKVFSFFHDVLREKGYSAFSLSSTGIYFYVNNEPVEGYNNLHEVATSYSCLLTKHLGFYSFLKGVVVDGLQKILDLYFSRYPNAVIWVDSDNIMLSKQGDWSDTEIFPDFYEVFAPVIKG